MSEMYDPAHPGEMLREFIPEGMSVTELAARLGVTRQTLSAVLNGRAAVSAEMALRLEAAFGKPADFWLRLQIQRDLWHARQKPPSAIARIAA